MADDLYPLTFSPIYKHKVWGGDAMAKHLGRLLPGPGEGEGEGIGESWELADLGSTSASGGGGGAERSVVADGPLKGATLAGLVASHGRALLGDLPLSAEGGFPILLKYLDANANLSVQVHPSPGYAAEHADAHLKSEAWYVVAAEPGACIYKGVDEGVTAGLFESALKTNDANAVEPLLLRLPVKPGDCHYLPSGTVHALGAGVLVAEVQTPSDTTFRVFDWGREGRELHVAEALQCIEFRPPDTSHYEPGTTVEGAHATRRRLVACEHFEIEEVTVRAGFETSLNAGQPEALMLVRGRGVLSDPVAGERAAPKATTVLVPPGLQGATLRCDAPATVLRVTFPQAVSQTV